MPALIPPLRESRTLLLLSPVLFIVGCTTGTSDLETWVKDVKLKAENEKTISEIAPEVKALEPFEFDPKILRDPFALANELNKDKPANPPRPDPNRIKEILEIFPLDALKMVGTIGVAPDIEALIKDPGGTISRVRLGQYMGQNEGQVKKITEINIELVEKIADGNNGWMERPAEIALGDK